MKKKNDFGFIVNNKLEIRSKNTNDVMRSIKNYLNEVNLNEKPWNIYISNIQKYFTFFKNYEQDDKQDQENPDSRSGQGSSSSSQEDKKVQVDKGSGEGTDNQEDKKVQADEGSGEGTDNQEDKKVQADED